MRSAVGAVYDRARFLITPEVLQCLRERSAVIDRAYSRRKLTYIYLN